MTPMKPIIRYTRIYGEHLRLANKIISLYRINAVGLILATGLWSVLIMSTIFLTTRGIRTVFGYTAGDLLAIGALQVIFLGVFHGVFTKNLENFPHIVVTGKLDLLLLQPISTQWIVSIRQMRPIAFLRVPLGIILLALLALSGRIPTPTVYGIVSSVILVGASEILIYSVWFMVATLLIWLPTMSNIVELLYQINVMSRYPYDFYREITWWVALCTFPFSIAIAVPYRALVGRASLAEMVILILTAGVFFAASRSFWHHALRSYSSASN